MNDALDLSKVPPETCPICRQRALNTSPGADEARLLSVCDVCGSRFEVDRETRRSQYVYLAEGFAARYPQITERLIANRLTRREIFELVSPASWQPPSAMNLPVSSALVWLVLIAAGLTVAIVCSCAMALLLSPGMAQTRRLIAAANAPTATAPESAGLALSPLDSPLQTPGTLTATLPVSEMPATPPNPELQPAPLQTIDVSVATVAPEAIPTIDPAAQATEPAPDQPPPPPAPTPAPPQPIPDAGTATLPPTFTPPPPTPIPQPTAPPTPSPASSPTENPAATPTLTFAAPGPSEPSPTPDTSGNIITGSVVITTVMYQGDPTTNESNEFVEIVNQSSGPIDLSNWTLRAASTNQVYTFSNGTPIYPGEACRVYTNSPIPFGTCGALTFASQVPVWSNLGDVAELRDANGVLVSRWLYVGTQP